MRLLLFKLLWSRRIARRATWPLLPIAISRRPAALACQRSCQPRLRMPMKWSHRSLAACMVLRSAHWHHMASDSLRLRLQCAGAERCTTEDCWPVSELALACTTTAHEHSDIKHTSATRWLRRCSGRTVRSEGARAATMRSCRACTDGTCRCRHSYGPRKQNSDTREFRLLRVQA